MGRGALFQNGVQGLGLCPYEVEGKDVHLQGFQRSH